MGKAEGHAVLTIVINKVLLTASISGGEWVIWTRLLNHDCSVPVLGFKKHSETHWKRPFIYLHFPRVNQAEICYIIHQWNKTELITFCPFVLPKHTGCHQSSFKSPHHKSTHRRLIHTNLFCSYSGDLFSCTAEWKVLISLLILLIY